MKLLSKTTPRFRTEEVHVSYACVQVRRQFSGKRPLWYTSDSLDMSFFKDEIFSRFAVNASDSDDSDIDYTDDEADDD